MIRNINKIKELVAIANELDSRALTKEADRIDTLIKSAVAWYYAAAAGIAIWEWGSSFIGEGADRAWDDMMSTEAISSAGEDRSNPEILLKAWLQAIKTQDLEEDLPFFGGAWMGYDDAWPSDADDTGWDTFSHLVRRHYKDAGDTNYITSDNLLGWAKAGGYKGGVGTKSNEDTVASYVEAFNSIIRIKNAAAEAPTEAAAAGIDADSDEQAPQGSGADPKSTGWYD
jgi:hypothetical protein|tara:strand:- start:362 stop:1045 length:684 start_codon:yes stop_codon:yes gene_type:complete